MKVKIALTNLGKYNEGSLVYTWLTLPITNDELQEALEEIGINSEYEEYFISDYEAPFHIDEYESIAELNEKATILSEFNSLAEVVNYVNSYNRDLEEFEIFDNDDDFFEIFFTSKIDAVRAVYFGDYNYSDPYVCFNGYGNLVSYSESQYEQILEDNKDHILETLFKI